MKNKLLFLFLLAFVYCNSQQLSTAGPPRLRIMSGYVNPAGLPGNPGEVYLQGGGTAGIAFVNVDGTPTGWTQLSTGGGSGNDTIWNSVAHSVYLNSMNQNVGLGTATPIGKLQVIGATFLSVNPTPGINLFLSLNSSIASPIPFPNSGLYGAFDTASGITSLFAVLKNPEPNGYGTMAIMSNGTLDNRFLHEVEVFTRVDTASHDTTGTFSFHTSLDFSNHQTSVVGTSDIGGSQLLQMLADTAKLNLQDGNLYTNVSIQIQDGTQRNGGVLTSDVTGKCSFGNGQLPNSVDSLTGLTGQAYSPTKNTATAIKASSTIVSLTITVPTATTGDALEFGFKNVVTTLSWSGVGSSALPTLSTVPVGGHITLRNTAGEWSFD